MKMLAPAKVNLFLHVGSVKANGRHDLQSLVVFADERAADRLGFEKGAGLSLNLTGAVPESIGDVEDNLVLKATRALSRETGRDLNGVFELEKRLPVAAGIGGGSADAAAAMRLLMENFALPVPAVKAVAPTLGGDVPVALYGRAAMMEGEGEVVRPVHLPDSLPAVLVNPRLACPTGPIFKAFDVAGGGKAFEEIAIPSLDDRGSVFNWLSCLRNDLETPACHIVPEIKDVLRDLEALPDQRLVRMSGSGATCFALFDTEADAEAAASRLQTIHPDWWITATLLS